MPHNRFALALPSVRINNADKELGERFRRAARNIGAECVLVDRQGYEPGGNRKVSSEEVDFLIATHFLAPKSCDVFSLVCTFSPLDFYFIWGYENYSRNLMRYDDCLGCGSPSADDQVRRLLPDDPLHLPAELPLYATVPEPVIEPTVMQRRLCYISTNWDPARHRELLLTLDKQNRIEFYGPKKKIYSKDKGDNWKGYRNHKGELPFDGRSVVERIAEAGAVLAFSSDQHIRAEMMTSRLFEGLAAGALVICDQNPFNRKHFGDSLLHVDTWHPDAAEQIVSHLDWMNANPEQAAEMARQAQKIFQQRFSADFCLKNIYARLDERKKALQFGLDPADATNPMVRVLYLLTDPSEQGWQRLRDFCLGQDYRRVQLQLLLEPGQQLDSAFAATAKKRGIDLKVQEVDNLTERSATEAGSVLEEGIREALKEDDFDCLGLLTSAEQPFSNHLSSQVRLFRARPDCTVAATAEVFETPGPDLGPEVLFDPELKPRNPVDFTADLDEHPIGFARFLFRRQALDEHLFSLLPYLNRKALAALVAERPLVQSGLTTVLANPEAPFFRQPTDAVREDALIRQAFPSFARPAAPGPSRAQQHLDEVQRQLQSLTADRARRRRKIRRSSARAVALLAAVAAAIWWFAG